MTCAKAAWLPCMAAALMLESLSVLLGGEPGYLVLLVQVVLTLPICLGIALFPLDQPEWDWVWHALIVAAGYWQWFIALPCLWRKWKRWRGHATSR